MSTDRPAPARGSFRRRMFLAILAVALVPSVLAVAAGLVTLSGLGSTTGTLGPWDAVAASGEALVDEARRAAPGDTVLARVSRAHREALTESLRQSRLWTFVTQRALRALPWLALFTLVAMAGLAFAAAGVLSRSFARPIRDLVGWTERIARREPLPDPSPEEDREVREVRRLRDALRSMDAELVEARRTELEGERLRAWTDMARRIAHELKNPLTPIRLAATTLARSPDEATADAAGVMLEEVTRLDEMARSFAQLGRMPEGPRSEIDLGEMLEGLARRHGVDGVQIEVESSGTVPMIHGYHDVLQRVLRNLIVNAVEASQAAGTDTVRVRVSSDGTTVRITVRDRGPGIPEDVRETLWMPDVTTKSRGTGLGLAIVRQGVEVHGGRAVARNLEEGGAEFLVTLPVDPMTDTAEGA